MTTPPPLTIDALLERAKLLSEQRAKLNEIVGELQKGIEALKADRMSELRTAIESATNAWTALEADIQAHPELFVKPRTVRAHGIKFGLEKGKGALEIADPANTVRLIRKHLPDQADVLIATVETPVKDALAQLPATELKRIGAELKDAGDRVVIRPADGEMDKLVRALIKAAVDESEEQGS
jgi:hypothetical protein